MGDGSAVLLRLPVLLHNSFLKTIHDNKTVRTFAQDEMWSRKENVPLSVWRGMTQRNLDSRRDEVSAGCGAMLYATVLLPYIYTAGSKCSIATVARKIAQSSKVAFMRFLMVCTKRRFPGQDVG
jgi:hypothetical protein